MDKIKKEIKHLLPAILGCTVALIIGELIGFALGFSPYLFPNADVKTIIELEILLKSASLVLIIGSIVGFFVILLLLLAYIRHGKSNNAISSDVVAFTDESPEEFDDVEKVETDDKDDPEKLD